MLPVFVTAAVMHEGVSREVVVDHELQVSVGDKINLRVPRQDVGAVYSLEGLPMDAVAHAEPDGIVVHWEPRDTDVGTFPVRVDVRQGDEGYVKTVRFVVNEHGHQLFVPGAVSTLFIPNDLANLGAFIGGGVELVFFFYADQGNLWVPSHGRFYLSCVVMGSTQPGMDAMIMAAAGFDLSLERNPGRRFLLPYVGIQSGIAYQKELGSFGWAMPVVGLYPWASRTFRISVLGGYELPTTAAQNIRGFVVSASLDVKAW